MKRIITIFIMLLLLPFICSADTGWKDISVWYGATVTINGESFIPTDSTGKTVEPFIYEGTTYMPMRAVVEALGAHIEWDANNKVVMITYSEAGTPSPETEPIVGGLTYDFPFHLYSDDGEYNYLGKLVTGKHDTDGLWNDYSNYGGKYGENSIWNKYGDYGSKYGQYSAFYKYASNPPLIVDDNGEIFGYLTEDKFQTDGYTILELYAFLVDNGQ